MWIISYYTHYCQKHVRNYLMAIYNNRVENFKSVFLIDNILGRIEESENELQDGKLALYFCTRDEDS